MKIQIHIAGEKPSPPRSWDTFAAKSLNPDLLKEIKNALDSTGRYSYTSPISEGLSYTITKLPLEEIHTLRPEGDRAKNTLQVVHHENSVATGIGGHAPDAGAFLDWYNDRLQICVNDGILDEPALHVRLNADGSIAEIIIRDDLRDKIRTEAQPSPWQKERDGEI